MEQEEQSTVTIDEKEYIFDELPKSVQHCCLQLREAEALINTTSLEVERHKMMHRGYVVTLQEEMEKLKNE